MSKQYSYNGFISISEIRSKIFKEEYQNFKPDKDYSLVDINKYRVKGSDQTITLGIMVKNGLWKSLIFLEVLNFQLN